MMRDRHIFIILVLISFVGFLFVYPFTMVGGDEGRFVQDALRIGRGEVPIADYGTRAPLLSWFINAAVELFGRSLFVFRLPVILFSALTAGFIFLLGKEFFDKRVGVISALIFAFIPLTLWNNVVIKTEALATLCTVIAAICFIKGLKQKKEYFFLLSGIMMGVAYTERHTAVVFMLTSAMVVMWQAVVEYGYSIKGLKEIIQRGFLLLAGAIMGFLPVFLFIAYFNFDRAVTAWLSIEPVVRGASTKTVDYASMSASLYGFLRNWGLVFVETLAVQGVLLFIGLFVFLLGIIAILFKHALRVRYILMIGLSVIMFGAFLAHALTIIRIGTFRPDVFLALVVGAVPLTIIFIFYEIYEPRLPGMLQVYSMATVFICFWITAHIVSFSFYVPGYARELVPQLSIITALLFAVFPWRNVKKSIVAIVFVAVGVMFGASAIWFSDPIIGWWWRQDTIYKTAEFLADRTEPGERVFTANPLPVMLIGRKTVADITSYAMVFAVNSDDAFSTFPSPNEMHALLEAHPPQYTLVDGRMESHFFNTYPFFEEFVKDNYIKVATFGTGRKRDWTEVWELVK
jgi:hypothetical protein